MKVFCKGCEYIEYLPLTGWRCNAPKNLADNWYRARAQFGRQPRDINRDNDCNMYKEKPQEDCDE